MIASAHLHIEALIKGEGHIMIGAIKLAQNVALSCMGIGPWPCWKIRQVNRWH